MKTFIILLVLLATCSMAFAGSQDEVNREFEREQEQRREMLYQMEQQHQQRRCSTPSTRCSCCRSVKTSASTTGSCSNWFDLTTIGIKET